MMAKDFYVLRQENRQQVLRERFSVFLFDFLIFIFESRLRIGKSSPIAAGGASAMDKNPGLFGSWFSYSDAKGRGDLPVAASLFGNNLLSTATLMS